MYYSNREKNQRSGNLQMKKCGDYIIRDADDEEPDCMMCDHCLASNDFCSDCGNWWLNYRRTTHTDDEPITENEYIALIRGEI